MMSRDVRGLSFPDICFTVEEKPRKKPQPGKLILPGVMGGSPGELSEEIVT